jgi:hypothetical protein
MSSQHSTLNIACDTKTVKCGSTATTTNLNAGEFLRLETPNDEMPYHDISKGKGTHLQYATPCYRQRWR